MLNLLCPNVLRFCSNFCQITIFGGANCTHSSYNTGFIL